jgi:hypothetical protein
MKGASKRIFFPFVRQLSPVRAGESRACVKVDRMPIQTLARSLERTKIIFGRRQWH